MNRRIRAMVCCVLALGASPLWARDLAATLEWARRVELGTLVSGTVHRVSVDPGDRVKRDQVLIKLDARGFEAEVARTSAELARYEKVLEEATREWDRAKELYERTVLSDHELQLAEIGYVEADANYRSAKALLTQAELDLHYSAVRAPFDGVAIRRDAELGQTVVSRLQSMPLVVVAETGRMVARAWVSLDEAAGVIAGQALEVSIAGVRYAGTVRHLGLEPAARDGGEARYVLDVLFEYPPERILRAGQKALVHLP